MVWDWIHTFLQLYPSTSAAPADSFRIPQVSDLAPKLEVTLLGTPLESYTQRMYHLQRSIKAEAQALLTALEEVIHVGGEGGSGRNVPPEVEAGTVMPVCAYMAR